MQVTVTKMKRFFALLLSCLMVFFMFSCKKGNSNNPGDETGDGSSSTIPTCSYTYEIKEDIFVVHENDGGGKSTETLRYPVISGMKDEAIQTKVNDTLKSIAEEKYKRLVPDVEIYIMEETLFNYEVANVAVTYASDKFISIKNETYLMTSLAAMPQKAVYTVNIDLTSGNVLEGEDIYSDFTSIISMFIDGEFTQEYGEETLLENTSYEDMILQYKSDYASYPETYFTPNSLIINIDLVNYLGTSAGFSISLDKVEGCLKFIPRG